MKFREILLILGIVAIASVFVMNASFAASGESLSVYKDSSLGNFNKKIVSIDQVSSWKNGTGKDYYKINIKKAYKNKYKIKSVTMGYFLNDNSTYYETKDMLYKNYTGKNKNSLIIKFSSEAISPEKLTINYYTKGKIKKETFYPYSTNADWKSTSYFTSNKANAKLTRNISIKNSIYGSSISVTHQKIKIATKNKNYKIQSVKLILLDLKKNKVVSNTFKGYGKNSLKLQLYQNKLVQDIKVYY
jgi:hypothetical protein